MADETTTEKKTATRMPDASTLLLPYGPNILVEDDPERRLRLPETRIVAPQAVDKDIRFYRVVAVGEMVKGEIAPGDFVVLAMSYSLKPIRSYERYRIANETQVIGLKRQADIDAEQSLANRRIEEEQRRR